MPTKKQRPDWSEIQAKSRANSKVKKEVPKEEIKTTPAKSKREPVVGGATQPRNHPVHLDSRLDYVDKDLENIGVGPEVKRRAT